MTQLVSKQTGSIYNVDQVVGPYTIAYRQLEDNDLCRVRIQADTESLRVLVALHPQWGPIKGGDHVSRIYEIPDLGKGLTDALLACDNHTLRSAQTGSLYELHAVEKPVVFVASRNIGNDKYRVRVQSSSRWALRAILNAVDGWDGGIKNGDHISQLVEGEDARDELVAAIRDFLAS